MSQVLLASDIGSVSQAGVLASAPKVGLARPDQEGTGEAKIDKELKGSCFSAGDKAQGEYIGERVSIVTFFVLPRG